MTSDGEHVWIADACVREVFKYTRDGQLVGNWNLDSRNGSPDGIMHHPDGFEFGLWVVDASRDQIFTYPNGTTHVEGRHQAAMTHDWTGDNGTGPTFLRECGPTDGVMGRASDEEKQ